MLTTSETCPKSFVIQIFRNCLTRYSYSITSATITTDWDFYDVGLAVSKTMSFTSKWYSYDIPLRSNTNKELT